MSEFVMVKRELLQRAVKGDASKGANALQLVDAWKAMDELRAVLAQEAGLGDPFAWAVEISGSEKIFSSKKAAENARRRYEKVFDAERIEPFPIYRHQASPPQHPIIKALNDPKAMELVALKATVAQQAQMIEWMQKGRGEAVACNHEWTDDGEHLLVCTACGAQEDHNPEWRDMSTAPRDGTMLRLLVEFEEHSTEDEDQAPTIGANNFDHDGEDEWKFAGWCWSHDHFTQGRGEPVGWLPMLNGQKVIEGASPPAPVAVLLPDRPDAIIEGVMTSVGISHAIYACTVSLKDREQVKLYRNRPALMALPERKATIAFGEPDIRGEAWNACLDKVKELNQ